GQEPQHDSTLLVVAVWSLAPVQPLGDAVNRATARESCETGRLFASPPIVVGVEPEYVPSDNLDESCVVRPVAAPSDAVIVGRVWFEALQLVRRMAPSVRAARLRWLRGRVRRDRHGHNSRGC